MSKNKQKESKIKKINSIRTTIEMQKQNSAKLQIEEYLELYGKDTYIMLEQARYYKLIGKIKESINILETLILENPYNIGYILFELAKTYQEQGLIEQAIETYKMIERTNHKNKTFAYNALALIYMDLYMYDEAKYYFEKVIQSEDRVRELAKINLSKIYRHLGEYDKAIEILDSVVAKNNGRLRCSVIYSKAKILKRKGMYEEAEQLYDDILIKYDSNYHPAIFEKVSIAIRNNRFLEAQKLYKSIENVEYHNKYFTLIKAEYNLTMGNIDFAKELYDSITIEDNVYGTLVAFGLFRISVIKGDLDRAIELCEYIMNRKDEYYNEALIQLIEVELYNKNFTKSLELFKQIHINKLEEKNIKDYKIIRMILEIIFNFPTVYEASEKYSYQQLIDYDLDRAVKHIGSGHKNKGDSTNFYNGMNIKKLLVDIKPLLKKENIIEISTGIKYLINYPNIGYSGNTKLDYLIVVTEVHNDNIITMYPCNQYGFDKIEEEIEQPKQKEIKRISQIDKFNKRYGLK